MKNRRLSLFFVLFLILGGTSTILAQAGVAVALNEYCVSNSGPSNAENDNFGKRSDWLELYNNYSADVNLSNYYLSNDKNNLFKWKFPSGYVILVGQYKTIWLSGKDVASGNNVHTNFTMDQCKNQWLILTNSNGVVMDSIFVKRTKEGHSRGRVRYDVDFSEAWHVFTTTSLGSLNVGPSFLGYTPRPIIRLQTNPLPANPVITNVGGFYPVDGDQNFNIYLENGVPYDSVYYDCFRVYYTLDGSYPTPGAPTTFQLMDSMPVISNNFAHIIRAISVPKPYPFTFPNPSGCQQLFLPGFCETNTYFTDPAYQEFAPDFGVISLAMDTTWLNTTAATNPTIHVEYYDKKEQVSEGYATIKKPINEAWLTKQKGFNITIDDRKGFGCNFEGKIFNVEGLGSSERTVFPTLHLKAGDYESHSSPINGGTDPDQGTGIMDVFYQSLAAKHKLNVSPLHIKPVVVFMNGKYWGVYDLREVYDKHYENYYNGQSKDSLDLFFFHNATDGFVSYPEVYELGGSNFSGQSAFANSVYTLGISSTIGSMVNYNKLFSRLDKASFIDYMILNSYAMNSNLWNYNIAYARGLQTGLPGDKWHYYLWNLPSIFNFTAISINNPPFYNTDVSPCYVHTSIIPISPSAGNGHRNILYNLMTPPSFNPTNGKTLFQQDYKSRYQDLLNGPLSCDVLLKHYDYVKELFLKEMKYHEDPASVPVPGNFITAADTWDTTTVRIRRGLEKRCKTMQDAFGSLNKFGGSCYGMTGPYPLTVDVQPAGAGAVKLNSNTLTDYVWSGLYFGVTNLKFKAIPTNTNYVFHHWEFKNHAPLNQAPISLDSVSINYTLADDVVAVFTDKLSDITMPSAFSPNGDNNNDVFRPVGSALYARDFDMSIWNRWGQEIYRSTDPTKGWDGTSRGEMAQTGVYAYVVTYKNIYNESKILKGNLTLLR